MIGGSINRKEYLFFELGFQYREGFDIILGVRSDGEQGGGDGICRTNAGN